MPRSLTVLLALSLLALTACPPGDDDDDANDPNADNDGDGLTAAFEASIYTSDDNADTDGDGFSDAFEQLAYFRPYDAEDFPYTGGYPRGPQPTPDEWDTITAESGWAQGDISRNWTAVDQHGETLRLKRFYGQVVLVDFSAEWCGPCRQAASEAEGEYQERADEGFIIAQFLLDGFTPGDRSPNVDRWIGDFGLTLPVFDDGDEEILPHYVPSGSFGIPLFAVIDRDFRIQVYDYEGYPPPMAQVDQYLEAEGPEVASWLLPPNADELRADLGFSDSPFRGYVDAM